MAKKRNKGKQVVVAKPKQAPQRRRFKQKQGLKGKFALGYGPLKATLSGSYNSSLTTNDQVMNQARQIIAPNNAKKLSNALGAVIEFEEPLTEIYDDYNGTRVISLPIGIGNTALCPWGAMEAKGYNSYYFIHFCVVFVPLCPKDQDGYVGFAYSTDMRDPPPTTFRQFQGYPHASIFSVTKRTAQRDGLTYTIPVGLGRVNYPHKRVVLKGVVYDSNAWYGTWDGTIGDQGIERFQGTLHMMTVGSNSGAIYGTIHARYAVQLIRAVNNLGADMQLHLNSTAGLTATQLVGTIITNDGNSSLPVARYDVSTWRFYGPVSAAMHFVIDIFGTGLATPMVDGAANTTTNVYTREMINAAANRVTCYGTIFPYDNAHLLYNPELSAATTVTDVNFYVFHRHLSGTHVAYYP